MNFIYDGRSSAEFNIVIKSVKGRHDTPTRDIETIEIPGRDGALYIDNESYKPKKIEIDFYIKSDVAKYSRLIDAWLYSKFEIKKLFFDDELDIYYEGICINKISFSEAFKYFNECKIVLECKPYKRLFDGDNGINITTNRTTLFNPTGYNTKPYLKIIGSGDINLYINNKAYIFKGIESFIELDSEDMNCYKTVNNVVTYENSKMYTPSFPKLEKNENIISWIGNVSSIEIKPRWCLV